MFAREQEITGHSSSVYSLAYDHQFLYSASADKFVTRWDVISGLQDKFALQFDSAPYAISIINSGSLLLVGLSSGLLYIVNLGARKVEKEYDLQASIFCFAENPHLNHFYAADANGVVTVFHSSSFEKVLAIPLSCGKIRRIAVNLDGTQLAVAGQDGRIRIFETNFYNEVANFQGHENGVTALCFDKHNPAVLYSGGKDALLKKWNLDSLQKLVEIPAHNFVIYDIVQLAEDTLITASRDKSIKIFSLPALQFLQRLDSKMKGHRHSVNSLVKIDEHCFASAGDDKRILIWR